MRTSMNRLILALALLGSMTPMVGAGITITGVGGGSGPGGATASGNDGVGGIERAVGNKKPVTPGNTAGLGGLKSGWSPLLPSPPTVALSTSGWIDLGHALAGQAGRPPALSVLTHDTTPGLSALLISGGQPGLSGWMVLGRAAALKPYHGGVMVPQLDIIIPVTLDNRGQALIPLRAAPLTLPTILYGQAWLRDAGGPAGLSATNGLALLPL